MSETNKLTGTITHIFETQTFPSGFCKREFVVKEHADKYPQSIKFEITKDKCSVLDRYSVGDIACVSYNIQGNEYNGKFFVNLHAWRIDGQNKDEGQRSPSQNGAPPPPLAAMSDALDEEDDIPF